MPEPWKQIGSQPLANYRIFSVRTDRLVSPRTQKEHDFFVIDCVNWVNVIGITPDEQLIMIEQYRHGSHTIELEVPGGMMEASDPTPVAAGLRELREETGFGGEAARQIGQVYPNPAIMTNTCYTVLVEQCRPVGPVQWDAGEDLATRLVPLAEVPGLVAAGKIRHSLVVVALYHLALKRR